MDTVNLNGHKRAVIYARVSTDDQADKGYSLPSQLEACEKYAVMHGFEVVGRYADDCSGTTPIGNRPEGGNMAAELSARRVNALIVYQVDRLSRDIVDLLASVRTWIRAGIEVYTLDIGKIKNELDIVLVIKGWQGGDEREKIRERTTRGRNAKAVSGKVVGNGKALYGYQYVYNSTPNGKRLISGFEIVKHEADIVKQIYQWYVGRNGELPIGANTIAQRLADMGIPTPDKRKSYPGRNNRGNWNIAQVRFMLANETYAGKWHYGKRTGKHGEAGKRPIEDQIEVEVPAIVDRELWDAAQSQRTFNVRVARRNNTCNQYLLRGMITCGCGYSYVGITPTTGHRKPFYICGRNRNKTKAHERCYAKRVQSALIEPIAWNYLIGVVTQRDMLESRLREAQAQMSDTVTPLQSKLKAIDEMIAEAEAEAETIAAAMKSARGIVADSLKRQADELDRRYTELNKRRDTISAEIEAAVISDQSITDIMQFSDMAIEGLNNATFEDKRRWLEYLRVNVVIQDRKAHISCMMPVDANVFDLNTF